MDNDKSFIIFPSKRLSEMGQVVHSPALGRLVVARHVSAVCVVIQLSRVVAQLHRGKAAHGPLPIPGARVQRVLEPVL